MTTPTIVVLEAPDGVGADLVAALCAHHPSAVVVHPSEGDADLSMRTCAAINDLRFTGEAVVVAAGRAALLLPAVARSQRAMRRGIVGYLLLDPELPTVSDAWPDARVTVVCEPTTEASLQARLRGWDVLSPGEIDQWQLPGG